MIRAEALTQTVLRAHAEGWGYIWGTAGKRWTAADQRAAARESTRLYGERWIGHRVADCSGLIRWAFRELGGDIAHGSDSQFRRYTVNSGTLTNGLTQDGLPLLPGTAVFIHSADSGRYEHVGLYVGGGEVVEARGVRHGVVKSPLNARWTHWGTLKGVDYSEEGQQEVIMDRLYQVTAEKGSWVRLRGEPSTSGRDLAHVPVGAQVEGGEPVNGWVEVVWQGERGWMQARFLKEMGDTLSLTLTRAEAEALLPLLTRLKAVMA